MNVNIIMSFIQHEACFSLGLAFLLQQQILSIPIISWTKTITINRTTKKAPAMAAGGIRDPTLTC